MNRSGSAGNDDVGLPARIPPGPVRVDEHLGRTGLERWPTASRRRPSRPRALRCAARSPAGARSRSSRRAAVRRRRRRSGRRRRRGSGPPTAGRRGPASRGRRRAGGPSRGARRRRRRRSRPSPRGGRRRRARRAIPDREPSGPGSTRCHGRPLRRPGGSSAASASRGSRNARFACTGPGPIGPATASATRRLPSERQLDPGRRRRGRPGSTAQRSAPANSPTCSTVCGAPT